MSAHGEDTVESKDGVDQALSGPDPWRWLRFAWRLPLLLVLILSGIVIVPLLLNPPAWRFKTPGGRRSIAAATVVRWSRVVCRVYGIRLVVKGSAPTPPALLVANHVSWLDIIVLHAVEHACFVAKSEIMTWPLIGWYAAAAGTIYHRRGSSESKSAVSDQMRSALEQGRRVAIFPEGTTADGHRLRRFHGRLLQPALDLNVPMVPVALSYQCRGRRDRVAFTDDESFVHNALRLMGEKAIIATVEFLPELEPGEEGGRRELALQAQGQIARAIEANEDSLAPTAAG